MIERARCGFLSLDLAAKCSINRLIDSRNCFELIQRDYLIPSRDNNYEQVRTVEQIVSGDKHKADQLIDTIDSMHLPRETTISLEAPLNNVIRQLDRNNDVAVCNTLKAFLNQVDQKEINGQLTPMQSADLRQQATAIKTALGCSSTATSSYPPLLIYHR